MVDVRVLIVDDHQPFRTALAALVAVAPGLQVVGLAGSGEESMALAAELRPDLVLMDLHLPGIDGLTAAGRLADLPQSPAVVLISTVPASELPAAATADGPRRYLDKADLDLDRLEELRRWLNLDGTGSR
jgi:DNA-binding NarL/FixJ family response regulator